MNHPWRTHFSFAEVSKIVGVNINMEILKGKLINVHIKDKGACDYCLFYTNHNDPTIVTNPTNAFLSAYSYLPTVKQYPGFLIILKFKER